MNAVQKNKSAAWPELNRLLAGFSPWKSQFVTTAPHVRSVTYSGTEISFVAEHFRFACDRTLHQLSIFVHQPRNGPWPQFEDSLTTRKWNKKENRLNACLYTARNRLINFCRANPAVYWIILCDNYRLSLPAATQPHVWAVGWACYICTINGPTGGGNLQLSDKIMTLNMPIYIHKHIALNLIPTASIWQSRSKSYWMLTLPPSYAGSLEILKVSSSWSLSRPVQERPACLLNAVHTAWHPI